MIIRTTRLFSSDKKKDREYLSPEDQWKMAGAIFGGMGAAAGGGFLGHHVNKKLDEKYEDSRYDLIKKFEKRGHIISDEDIKLLEKLDDQRINNLHGRYSFQYDNFTPAELREEKSKIFDNLSKEDRKKFKDILSKKGEIPEHAMNFHHTKWGTLGENTIGLGLHKMANDGNFYDRRLIKNHEYYKNLLDSKEDAGNPTNMMLKYAAPFVSGVAASSIDENGNVKTNPLIAAAGVLPAAAAALRNPLLERRALKKGLEELEAHGATKEQLARAKDELKELFKHTDKRAAASMIPTSISSLVGTATGRISAEIAKDKKVKDLNYMTDTELPAHYYDESYYKSKNPDYKKDYDKARRMWLGGGALALASTVPTYQGINHLDMKKAEDLLRSGENTKEVEELLKKARRNRNIKLGAGIAGIVGGLGLAIGGNLKLHKLASGKKED